jgi:hypothetical protein
VALDEQTEVELLKELKTRRKARASLLESIMYTAPWFKANWHHVLICELLERVDGIKDDTAFSLDVGATSKTVTRMCNGEEKEFPNSNYRTRKFKCTLPRHITRLMIFTPPRSGKSETVSIRRPAWSIGRDPGRMFMNIAYGSDLALTFSKSCVGAIQQQAFQRLFPIQFDRKANERWKVKREEAKDNQRDSMIASGIMSPLTGEGATDVNVDDPFKNKSEAYSQTIRNKVADEYQSSVRTRLQKKATVTLTLTRWHQDDLAGRLIKSALANKRADQWLVLVLAAWNDTGEQSYLWNTATGEKWFLPKYDALWPEWYDRESLEQTKASMATAFWEAMFMQAPTTASGNIFKKEKWQEFTHPITMQRYVHVWDTAMTDTDTADYSAHLAVGVADGHFVINDAYREQLTFPDLVRVVYEKWSAAVDAGTPPEALLIEEKGSGISLIQTIMANNYDPMFDGPVIPVVPMPAKLSKEVRALSIASYQEAKLCSLPAPEIDQFDNVYPAAFHLKDGTLVPWVADFQEELAAFPRGANDDWVDAFVHALTYYTRPHGEDDETAIVVYDSDEVTASSELDAVDNGSF